jgi:hypothetical protein
MQTIQEKLNRGIKILKEADNDPDLLGNALLKLHGALEDHFRNLLTTKHNIPTDMNQVQWLELVNLMQQYEGLSIGDRDFILTMNKLRNPLAHGGLFTGTRIQVEKYAEYVGRIVSSASCSPRYNVSSNESNYHGPIALPNFNCVFLSRIPVANITLAKLTGKILNLKEKQYTKDNSIVTHLEVWLQLQNGKEEYLTLLDFVPPLRKGQTVSIICGTSSRATECIAVKIHEMDMNYFKSNVWKSLPITTYLLPLTLFIITTLVITTLIISLFVPFDTIIRNLLLLLIPLWASIFLYDSLIESIFSRKFQEYLYYTIDQ